MKIINKELIDRFISKHADSSNAVLRWIELMEQSEISSHNELRAIFSNADYIGNSRYVFNIKGNDYRLVTVILFSAGIATVCFIGTHAEYDKIDCLTIIQR
jgi:mRNA interferase HigB